MRHRFRPSLPHLHHTRPAGRWAWVLALVTVATAAQAETGLTEVDFFEPVPVVLTATRLAQPLSDTPGAVTVVDRDTIRRSGARTLADVLRLVPGYIVSGYNGANPVAAYHAPIDEYGARNLVLVDGRSLYSTTYLAGTIRGMQTVVLDDIERIEVLRGSNSAAYGANAMFGVINVITRHAADTVGVLTSLSVGDHGIRDASVRLGWGNEQTAHRLTVSRRADEGYANVYDDSRYENLSWRSDIQLSRGTDLQISAGHTQALAGDGVPSDPGNIVREVSWKQSHLQAVLKRQLSESEQVRWSFSWDEDSKRDVFPYPYVPAVPMFEGVLIDASSEERRLNLEFQHQKDLGSGLRVVWGTGWKEDSAVSQPLFHTAERIKVRDARVFGNVEWALSDQWLLNAGLFAGDNSDAGGYASPRFMLNYRFLPEHTVRFGLSRAQRSPAIFDNHSDVRYFVPAWSGYYLNYRSSGEADPETLSVKEVSYYGRFPEAGVTVDVRAYQETLKNEINITGSPPSDPYDFVNLARDTHLHGIEYQLKWAVNPDAQLILNQSFTRLTRTDGTEGRQPPSQLLRFPEVKSLP